ncbi:MAG: ribosome silencing factor [Chitinophagaceae bacterium]|jgi:ribosome-associated protein|nr:ribosome silencing factor [Bacteroidota bacterium]MBK8405148.1 ribosome silencing factor [Candidatus Vicinibacter affinis]MBL7913722.1 ribosome silencing factor [Bacteroidia bacterium]MBP9933681.1 ribosome silencing factor [Chitinophagaceae bacterium]OQA08238.1 MAG: Ribosomal silencing factor RsfS [Bacteroidetes bacterium ADurb.Bin397]
MGSKIKKVSNKRQESNTLEVLADAVVQGIQEKKGHDIVVLDLKPTGTSIADFFIVCHGDSNTQVDALARSVEDEVHKLTGENPVYREGYENAEWILLDYISVVVHIFGREQRDFYGIERLWADAETKRIA